jgi:hypothetical protein
MEHIDCSACNAKTAARPPNPMFGWLIAGFWAASLVLGFFAAKSQGWSIVNFSAWVALATSVVLLARRTTSWTCVECGSSVPPPVAATPAPLNASYRALHGRHA